MNTEAYNSKIRALEKENADLKMRLNILTQALIVDDSDLMYLKLLTDEITKTS